MSSFTGQKVKDTYQDLLQLGNNNTGLTGTVNYIQDGAGTSGPLGLSTSVIGMGGHIIPDANAQYDIGSAEYKVRHLYLSDNSLHVGDSKMSETFFTGLSTFSFDDGNVGIGTTSPAAPLEIKDGAGRIRFYVGNDPQMKLNDVDGREMYLQLLSETSANQIDGTGARFRIYDQTEGLERFNITSDGNIGIGTTSPSDELHINSAGSNVNLRLTRDTDTGGRISCSDGADTPAIIFETIDSGNLSEKMRIDSAGNVGIGTTSPSASLECQGPGQGVALFKSKSTTAGAKTFVSIESPSATSNGRTRIGADVDDMFFSTSNGASDPNSSVERMRINSAGNVGIGTTSPGSKLHVIGGNNYNEGIILGARKDDGTSLSTLRFFHDDDDYAHISRGADECISISSDGNVGIGTTSPDTKLHLSTAGTDGLRLGVDSQTYYHMIRPNGDGLYLGADDGATGGAGADIRFSVKGDEKMRIESSGNVGIGTLDPGTNMLNIGETDGGGYGLTVNSPTTYGVNVLTTGVSGDQGALYIRHKNDAGVTADRFKVTTSGRVGIGMENPSSTLHMKGVNGGLTIDNTGERWTQIDLLSGGQAKSFIAHDSDVNRLVLGHQAVYGDNDGVSIRPDGSNDMFHVRRDGNTGVGGDASNWQKFTVHGVLSGNDQPAIRLQNNTTGRPAVISYDNLNNLSIGAHGSGADEGTVTLRTGGGSGTDRVKVDSDGLHVTGNIYQNGSLFASGAGGAGGTSNWSFAGGNLYPNVTNYKVGIGTSIPYTDLEVLTDAGDYDETAGISTYGITINDPVQSSLNLYHGGTGSSLSRIVSLRPTSGNSELAFVTQNSVSGRTEKMRIDNNGYVGIGTTDPHEILDIHSDGATIKLRDTQDHDTNSGPQILFQGNDANGVMKQLSYLRGSSTTGDNGDLSFHTRSDGDNTEKMRIDSAGNVGIGTTSPGKKLHVAGDSHQIVIEDTNAVAGEKMRGIYNNNQKLYIGRYTDDLNSFYDDMLIDSNGNVGIGTTTPAYKLDIAAPGADANGIRIHTNNASAESLMLIGGGGSTDVKFKVDGLGNTLISSVLAINSSSNPANYPYMQFENEDETSADGTNLGAIFFKGQQPDGTLETGAAVRARGAGDAADINNNMPAELAFQTNPGGTGGLVERMLIDKDGNVGIGTTDPGYKLHIVDSTNDGSGGIKVENYKPVIELLDSTTNATATTLTQDNSTFTIANNSVDSLTIDSSGKVGIGTDSPITKLHVMGNGDNTNPEDHDAGCEVLINNTSTTDGAYAGLNFQTGDRITSSIRSQSVDQTNNDGNLLFYTVKNSQHRTAMTIDPDRNMVVSGNITATGIISAGSITTQNQTTQTIEDKNITLGAIVGGNHTDTTAAGGGMILKGTTDKSLLWDGDWQLTGGRFSANSGMTLTDDAGIGTLMLDAPADYLSNTATSVINAINTTDLSLQTNNTDRVRLTAAGNVGIGTTSPDRNLVIDAGVNSSPLRLIARSSDENCAIQIRNSANTDTVTQLGGNTDSYFTGGNVGIGTTNPDAKLDLQASGHPFYIRSGAGANDNLFLFENPTAGPQLRMYEKGTSNVAVKLSTHDNSYFNGGNVGIGTTSPSAKITVKSGVNALPQSDISADTGTALRILGNDAATIDFGSTGRTNSGGVGQWIQSRHSEVDDTYYNLLLNPLGGNVGIGTTEPGAKLSVVETSGGTQFEVKGTAAIGGQFQINNAGGDIYANYRGAGSNDDVVKIDTNGDSFFNGGNVGIGTTSPVAKLEVNAGSTGTDVNTIRMDSDSGGAYNILCSDASTDKPTWKHQTGTQEDIQFIIGGSDVFYLESSGNVGIGITSPGSNLTVSHQNQADESPSGTGNGLEVMNAQDGGRVLLNTARTSGGASYEGDLRILNQKLDDGAYKWVENMRITSDGYVGIGQSSPSYGLHTLETEVDRTGCVFANTSIRPYGVKCLHQNAQGTATGQSSGFFFSGGAQDGNGDMATMFQIVNNGNMINQHNVYSSFSDEKLKENVVDATPKTEDLKQVRVVNYNLKSDPETKQIGVVAQELEEVFPGMVFETEDVDDNDQPTGESTKSVKYSVFVPMLVKAFQEQQAVIETMQQEIEALKNS